MIPSRERCEVIIHINQGILEKEDGKKIIYRAVIQ